MKFRVFSTRSYSHINKHLKKPFTQLVEQVLSTLWLSITHLHVFEHFIDMEIHVLANSFFYSPSLLHGCLNLMPTDGAILQQGCERMKTSAD